MGQLRDKLEQDLKLRRYRPKTATEYLRWAGLYAAHFLPRSPLKLGEAELREFLLYQLDRRKVGPASHKMAVAALKFFYGVTLGRPEVAVTIPWPKVPHTLPQILDPTEVAALLEAVGTTKHRAVVMTTYAAGMRISEACGLRTLDVDSKRKLIHIRDGKQGRDRYVMLSKQLLWFLRVYWKLERPSGTLLFPGDTQAGCVSAEAVRKAKQEIRRLARENPGAPVIVTGCAAQTEPETFAAMPEVTRVIGNTEKMQAETWAALKAPDLIGQTERIQVDDIMSVKETAGHLIDGFGRHRAYVQVQNGCDHRCTFCIIPYGRGNSRSVPAGVVVDQIRRLVDKGFLEVVLTGVDLTSWGADLPGEPRLGDLVMRILRLVPDLPRLRISSIDSIEADEALMGAIATERRLMPHLHLSLQAGDDMILKRMKRRHTREDAIRFCADLRAARLKILHTVFLDAPSTGDYTMTRRLREMVADGQTAMISLHS